ncbi:MAG: tetratricopeptide repeat protein [Roseibium album]|uniref:Photosystem I assembly protein Ycf3 n=1 Tax=Roseibium album TaxID=311410 RepID=A0A0M7AU02_9HYPH|nr:tetratricopeptide repeat protein [Roseibium album]MBG6145872.1 Flp pilus assembly protein TadD [Labrenzia sp. EL_142]MBG6154719.1 Flp pilus assembly protein TadD [Labrenzia sp. EL_162]MBG6161997.1 Flp pilus assembly protein TadD [Labrenzia sp. EL_195]MBG6176246.1 Flp pilus assembly protein TadD [Labrenzia sp. EL_132]MBG6193151.1 Flp pilus assembly protein TadD [Labrenzia sp. EL_159]MBG6211320.1 Flp pilus assembly protein TadD [Labrenzia sp. EL_126]MBG6231286.1 Flp pilus assembly protein T
MQAPRIGSVSRRTRVASALVAMTALVLVTGCASNKSNTGTYSPASGSHSVSPGSNLARAEVGKWAKRYDKDRSNRTAILGYSNALSQNGQIEQSLAVLRSGVIAHQKDREIASAYGKILAMNGRFDEALNVLRRAQRPDMPDWKIMSAEAAIYDQTGNHEKARSLYKQALKIAPDDPSLLNNLGLSYLLSNKLPDAEYNLRRAASLPNADSRVRQNLALVLGVQGKFEEAVEVATAELDPRQAQANIAYLRDMMQTRQRG